MTDAEYEELKYAAIAAGYKPVRLTDDGEALLREGIAAPWNPRDRNRHSDHMGDALRLAVKLRLEIVPVSRGFIDVCLPGSEPFACACEGGDDAEAATCLSITRAAARIGKQMGGGNV